MIPRILLVNPPIYDFSAYDFWLKPYGMLRAAGFLRGQAHFSLFDFLDRLDSRVPEGCYRSDSWGRGAFYSEPIEKPAPLRRSRGSFAASDCLAPNSRIASAPRRLSTTFSSRPA